MRILKFGKLSINGSPYIGIFCVVTDEFALLPMSVGKKVAKNFEGLFGVNALNVSLANSPLLGVFACAYGKKIVVPEIVEKSEIKSLENEGIEVNVMTKASALGNLIALNKNYGIGSVLFTEKEISELEKFFGIKFSKMEVAKTDVPGSCMMVTDKGFIINSNVEENEFKKLKKLFGVHGMTTTANYGDNFVSNSVLANSRAFLAGEYTSGIELTKIDEGLRGED